MRAVRYHEPGDPDVLRVEEIDRPSPAADEVLVAVRAAGVNPVDAKVRRRSGGPLPKTTGSDFAGTVEAVGDAVDEYAVGDRVFGTGLHTGRFRGGSFAEYVAVPTDVVAPLPPSVSFETGAAVALVGVTAWRALVDHARLEPGDTCFVHGGSGGVGHVAVQLADTLGGIVVATAGSSAHRDAVREFGADAALDYGRDDLLDAARDALDGGADVVLDHRVGDYLEFDVDVAAFGGRVVVYGGSGSGLGDSRDARGKELATYWMSMSNLATRDDLPTMTSILRPLAHLVAEGRLAATVARTYALDEAAEAHRAVMEDSFVGKLVVKP